MRGLILPAGLVDGDDSAGVERGVAIFVVAGEHLGFGMHDEEFAAVSVELDFAEESHAGAGSDAVGEPRAVEPFGEEGGA